MFGRLRLLAIPVVAGLAAVAGCGSDGSDVASPGRPADGAGLYAAACSACHGSDLRGTGLGPALLSRVYEPSHHPDESFRSAVANGVQAHHWNFGNMPPVPGLSGEEVDLIIAHVREVQEREGFID